MDPITVALYIGKFIWKYKYVAVVAVLLAIIFFQHSSIQSKNEAITKLTSTIDRQTDENKALRANLKLANNLIDKQNSSIDAYVAQASVLKNKLDALQTEYDAMDTSLHNQIKILLKNKPVPKDCPGAMDWLRDRAIEDYGSLEEVTP